MLVRSLSLRAFMPVLAFNHGRSTGLIFQGLSFSVAAAAVALSVVVGATGLAGWLYLIAAGLAGLELMLPALSLARSLSPISAWHLYKASSWYLAVVLIGLAADRLGLGSHLISVISGSAW